MDCKITNCPGDSCSATDCAADTTYDRSGVRVFDNGVGTQIVNASSDDTTE